MARTPSKKKNNGSRNSTPVKDNKKKAPVQEKSSLIPRERITRGIEELTKFIAQKKNDDDDGNKNQLLDDDEELNNLLQLIVVNNKSFTGTSKDFKLKMINVKHSLYKIWKNESVTSVKDFKILLILKDSDIAKISEDDLYDELNESGISIDQIICGKDLKTTYKSFEARRSFINDFSLILSDDSIITTLPKLLGGKAFEKIETTPVSIRTQSNKTFSKTTLINSIKKVYLNQIPIKLPRGTTLNVHLGKLDWFEPVELVDNIEAISEALIKNYSIRSIFIKSNNSPVLPLYFNQDVLEELTTETEKKDKEQVTVEIDGVQVNLSTFDRALMEISNPNEYSSLFAKQINAAKRQLEEDKDEASSKPIKKSKK
ncbi:hypothetical protein Kpol_1051p20 [Vanderwaltozyma polyspora DSM 70294]|uniref:Proteasome-interacting protein CIC1 n=1 Tax=Vanderwaltozyma polyspora (strain ATCC 22028 / DSM 70294 / BCRC 21397 / CBS 2163 / NBRC 10782 / NRRL Y-8283 / UCD 57-17) TaxID=436907 RepID=A7TMY3_VANPO|nr:uncharacterized protein Kpol_1051p20 [Vanderwaltozyma polyspora DSM 70294]EDO16371.1 hypothetical protein Kpol_1051p20 [Vanderwaltozyma polyspora DSM 70294]